MINNTLQSNKLKEKGYDLEELKSIKFISNINKQPERRNENESKSERPSNGKIR